MVKLKNSIYQAIQYLTDDFNNPKTIRFFFRALIAFTFMKMLMTWPLSRQVMAQHSISLPRSWMGKLVLAPAFLADYNIDAFYAAAILCLILVFFISVNYASTSLFFWLTVNLYVVVLPFANGSDIVLFMLAIWCIPMAQYPKLKSEIGQTLQRTAFNTSAILCQLLVICIYLVSGLDKFKSEAWRTGEAFEYIINLNTLYHPAFKGMFESAILHKSLSWFTIAFELLFVMLVWYEKTRLPILAIGIIFHLFIWIVLSLPDFALIMMISYVAFLKDDDIVRFKTFVKRWLL